MTSSVSHLLPSAGDFGDRIGLYLGRGYLVGNSVNLWSLDNFISQKNSEMCYGRPNSSSLLSCDQVD